MQFFENIIFNIIFITFPLMFYCFYIVHNKNVGKKENNLFLDFALLSSLYLIIRFGANTFYLVPLLIFNAILLIAYYKERNFTIFTMTLFMILCYQKEIGTNILWEFAQYSLYYILYQLLKRKNYSFDVFFHVFILIKSGFFISWVLYSDLLGTVWYHALFQAGVLILILYVITYFSIVVFNAAEEVIKYHMSVKELENEKQIRTSLFKITHEIKNPIAVCKGYLDMFDVGNPEHSKKYIPIMKEEIGRTLLLLQDFLSMRQIKIEKEIIDINLLIEEIEHNFSIMLKERNIDAKFDYIEDEIFIEGDYNRLTQVFINLVKNSVEAIPPSRAGKLSIHVEEEVKKIRIQIVDNGTGISKSVMKKISEPFYTTKRNGTGLGVSFSTEIITAHDGTISFESEEGYGTTVTILLPKYEL